MVVLESDVAMKKIAVSVLIILLFCTRINANAQSTKMPSKSEMRSICEYRFNVKPHELASCMDMIRESIERKQLRELNAEVELLKAQQAMDDKFFKVVQYLKIPSSEYQSDETKRRVYASWDAVVKDGFAKKCNDYGISALDDLKGFEICLTKHQILRNRMASD